MTLFISEKWFGGLLDPSGDVSVIAARHWPKSWPCQPSAGDLQWVGATHGPLHSAHPIHYRDEERHSGLSLCLTQSSGQSARKTSIRMCGTIL
jgi:hypothetical protein